MANNLVTVGLSRFEFLTFEQRLKKIYSKLDETQKRVKKAIDGAVRGTVVATRNYMAKSIAERVYITEESMKGSKGNKSKYFENKYKKGVSNVIGTLTLRKTYRFQLIHFGAMQDAEGVSYTIERGGERKFIKSAFITRANNQRMVTKRKGKKRLPIVGPLRGPSPWGVFVINNLHEQTRRFARMRLRKSLLRQIKKAEKLAGANN